jgi:hypothetical protein
VESIGTDPKDFLSFGNPLPCSSVTLNRAPADFNFSLDYTSNLDSDAWLTLKDAARRSYMHRSG